MELNYYENNGDNSVINDYIMDAVFMLIEKEDNLNHSEGRFVCLIILAQWLHFSVTADTSHKVTVHFKPASVQVFLKAGNIFSMFSCG